MKRVLLLASVIVAFFYSETLFAQMSGSYTIGGTGANFSTVVQAVDTLNANGVNGAVVFNIRSGVYSGRVKINNFTGSSTTNTVLFRPDTNNTSQVVIVDSAIASTDRGAVVLNGCKNVSFDSLTIRRVTTGNGHAIEFKGQGENVKFQGCYIDRGRVSTTSTFSATIYDGTSTANNFESVEFIGNTITGGSMAMYVYGTSTASRQDGWEIIDNRVLNFYYMGLYLFYQDNAKVNGNLISNDGYSNYAYPYGLYGYYCYGSEVIGNNISLGAGNYGYGLYWRYCRATSNSRKRIANNMVHMKQGFYGMRVDYADYNDIVFNTVKLDNSGTQSTSYAFYLLQGTAVHFRNNNVTNFARSFAFYNSGSFTRDYNNLYSNGSSALTGTSTTLGTNSMGVDPLYVATNDLHVQNVALFRAGVAYTGITTDIDGDTRGTVPCIGADEFQPDTLDAAARTIKSNYCAGSQTLSMQIQNFGMDTITSAKISWWIAKNGGARVAQTPATFSGSLPAGLIANVNLGTYTLSNDTIYQIWAIVDSVNNKVDKNALNDSTETDTFRTSLNGTYTIGGTNPDFNTVVDAVNALKASGVCGPTTFKIRSGTYNGALNFGIIPGISASDSVRFTADTGATQPVITSTSVPYTVDLRDVSHLTFDHLSIRSDFPGGGYTIQFNGSVEHIRFDSCYLRTDTAVASSRAMVVYNSNQAIANHISFLNSDLVGGYYCVYTYGVNTSSPDSNWTFINSNLTQFYYSGIWNYYVYGNTIKNCTIDNWDRIFPYSYCYSLRMYYSGNFDVDRNYIRSAATLYPSYQVYMYQCDGTTSNRNTFSNNMITAPRASYNTTSTIYQAYFYGSDYTDIYYNNFFLKSGGTNSNGLYANIGNGVQIRNNNFVTMGSGFAMRQNGNMTETHNNFYAPGGTRKNIAPGAANRNVDPEYISDHDLHVQSIALDGTALAITGLTHDFDGQTRNTTTPDIGADEFTPPANDLRPIVLFNPKSGGCGKDSALVQVIVRNNGTATQRNYRVTAMMYGSYSDTITTTVSDSIQSVRTDTVTVGRVRMTTGGKFRFVLITTLTGDQRTENDTLEVTDIDIDRAPSDPVVGSSIVVCDNIDTVLVNQSAAKATYWYDAMVNGNLLHTGDSFKVNLNTPDTFYVVGADDYEAKVGLPNNNGTSNNITVMTYAQVFDVRRELTLDSVTVYPNDSGTVTVRLLGPTSNIINTRTVSVPRSNGVRIPVGFRIPPGSGYKLDAVGTNTRGLMYNLRGAPYPFIDIDSSIIITSSSLSTAYWFYFYDWKISVEGCESGMVAVPVNTRPSLNISMGNDTAYCSGSTFGYTLNMATTGATGYRWQNGSTSSSQAINTKGTYSIAVTSTNGCVSRDTLVVTEVPQPTVTFTDTTVCDNQGSFLFQGNPRGGTISGFGVSNGRFYAGTAGTGAHNITYNYADSIGCVGSATAKITVNPAPTVSFTSPGTLCQNLKTATPLTGGSPTGAGYYFGPKVQGNKFFPNVTGNYTVYYAYFNGFGCVDTASASLQVVSAPVVTFDPIPSTACDNTPSISLTATPSGGVYSGNGVSGSSFDPSAAGKGTHTIKYTATGSNNCSTEEVQTIEIFEAPTASLAAFPSYCEYDGEIGLIGGLPNFGTYTGQHVNSVTKKFDATAAGAGTYPVTYTVTDFNNCADSATQNIVVNPTPNPNFGGDKQTCGSHAVSLDAGPGDAWVWSTSATSRSISVLKAGTYVVTVTANSCQGTDSVKVTYEAICVGIPQSLKGLVDVKYFPNPTAGDLNINLTGFDGMDISFEINTIGGQTVHQEVIGQVTSSDLLHTTYVGDLSEGIYIARIKTDEGDIVNRITISR